MRLPHDLDAVEALVLPGGESTAMSNLLRFSGLEQPLRERLAEGLPTLSTCAGLILLSREVLDGRPDQLAFGALDLSVRRNAYGAQRESFESEVAVAGLPEPVHGVFIRAPQIVKVGSGVQVLASMDGHAVVVSQSAHLALTFHPEVAGDDRLHRRFLAGLAGDRSVSAA